MRPLTLVECNHRLYGAIQQLSPWKQQHITWTSYSNTASHIYFTQLQVTVVVQWGLTSVGLQSDSYGTACTSCTSTCTSPVGQIRSIIDTLYYM